MRACLLWLVAVCCPPAFADLFTAQLAYRSGDYERAFKDYRELAELGQAQAQYNLAVMYARGQGVRQSELNAYAWATLAAEGGYAQGRSLADELRPELAPGSEKIAEDIRAPFSRAALDARLMPRMTDEEQGRARCRPRKVEMPDYPEDASYHGTQGWVYVEFTVMADGSARHPRVLQSVPKGVFDQPVRTALLRTELPSGTLGTRAVHCELMYRFVAQRQSAEEYPRLQRFVDSTRKKAEAGDLSAELEYGLLLAGLPQLRHKPADAMPWFLKAAQSGVREAQYEVGNGLLHGWGCHCEENKAQEWLRRAAEADQPNAQVTLATYALRGTPDAAQTRMASVWLERAAAKGDHDGMFYLSALLAATPVDALRDPKRALSLLDKVRGDLSGDPTAFEIRAAAQAASGDYAEAVASEERAIRMATRLKWDAAPLRERLARYESHQAWYGDLLGL